MPPRRGSIAPPAEQAGAPREVNSLLHTLRGEQFRHTQNVHRIRAPASYRSSNQAGPSLPYAQIYGSLSSSLPKAHDLPAANARSAAGPIPRSWAAAPQIAEPAYDSAEWRAEALSLVFADDEFIDTPPHTSNDDLHRNLPSLTDFCLRVVLQYYGTDADTMEDVAVNLPPHVRRQLLRLTAVHTPLPDRSLYALLGSSGHANGEAVIVGPHASLRGDFFRALDRPGHHRDADAEMQTHGEPEWDEPVDEWASPQPLSVLILLSVPLSVRTLLTLPPSLTRLALIHLPSAIPVYRLPDKCPLLEVLDLSFNEWLATPSWGEDRALQRVAWRRWSHLRVLACRGCGLDTTVFMGVNKEPWVDVKIVL